MLKIGLTGGIGCGKSTAVDAFRALGATIIDADQIAKDIVKKGAPALIEISNIFGSHIILPNGELDRRKLKEIVFSDTQALEKLEAITHPRIRTEIIRQMSKASESLYVVVDIPLLLEENYLEIFDRVVVVDCLPEQQIERVIQRGESNESIIKTIMKKQVSREIRLKAASDVLDNTGNINRLKNQVKILHDNFVIQLRKP